MKLNCEKYIYKVISEKHWYDCQLKAELIPVDIDIKDGYLHFSALSQLRETLRLYFINRSDLILLGVKIDNIEQLLKWEESRNNELFPHIYGTIQIEQIKFSAPIKVNEKGVATLPDYIKC